MIDFDFNADKNHVLITVTGANSFAEFESATHEFSQHVLYRKYHHRVCDFTQADLSSVSVLDFLRYIALLRKLPISRNPKVALVSANQQPILLMFLNIMTAVEVQMFRTLEEGLKWVAERGTVIPDSLLGNKSVKYQKITGELKLEMVRHLQQAWIHDQAFNPMRPIIWDLREAKFERSIPEMKASADALFDARVAAGILGRTAFLVATKHQEILLRNTFSEWMSGGYLSLFFQEQQALDWLHADLSGE